VRALKEVCLQPVESVLIARHAGVSPPSAADVDASPSAPLLAETPPSSLEPLVVDEPAWLGTTDPEATMAPADAMVLPLAGAPLAPVDETEAPLPVDGAVPAEPTEVAPADPPIVMPELAPVPTPVPLIGALHAPHAIDRTMLKAQPHAVPMRKVTFHIVRNVPLCATARLCEPYEMGAISWGDVH
jgi:hypothetical protein